MDLQPIHNQEATSSSSTSSHQHSAAASTSFTESKVLRSSARVKAAKQKDNEKGKDRELAEQASSSFAVLPLDPIPTRATRSPQAFKSKRARETDVKGKGKAKESSDEPSSQASKRARRATYPNSTALTVEEPVRDSKGKKRAVHDTSSGEEGNSVFTASTSAKRPRIASAYSLRSKIDTTTVQDAGMPKKTTTSLIKSKMALRNKAIAPVPAYSSPPGDDDVEMVDAQQYNPEPDGAADEAHDEGDIHDEDNLAEEEGDENGTTTDEAVAPSSVEGLRSFGGLDESAAMTIFGDYRQFGSYMLGLSGRLKTMLDNIKTTADPTTRLITLQELSELLSISTEDTLAGSFQVEQFVKELIKILGGRGIDEDEENEGDEDADDQDEDAALAAALAMSAGGGSYQGDENLEAQVLACRCLANLMEALPGVAHTVVYHGAIPVLCSKLIEISYIDLAEQTLSTMEKISEEFPSSIVREGGLAALLNYLDFFSIAVQRTALQAAANCCRNVSPDHFSMIRAIWPIIRNCLGYSDQRLVEFACLCIIRVIDSYYRAATENLEILMDTDLVRAVNLLLIPAGGSPLIAANTYTLLLRALATSARASPKITLALLEADVVDTLYQILTGVLPSTFESGEEQGRAFDSQGLGGGLADMTVMENLAHRSKDQVEEALSLISELMPPLPKDGVFDHKSYTEKSLAKLIKAKAKADRAAARQASGGINSMTHRVPASTTTAHVSPVTQNPLQEDIRSMEPQTHDAEQALPLLASKELALDRIDLLRSKPAVVGRFMQLMVPILVDVYTASVITPVRVKTLTGLLKAVSFLDGDGLKRVLTFVPVASFASSILSSKDHASLVLGALQLVDLLLTKVPAEYMPAFRREGVFHEIETLAARTVSSSKPKDKEKDKDISDVPSPADSVILATHASTPGGSATMIPGFKKLSSLSLEPDDAITLRARVIRFKHLLGNDQIDGNSAFDSLRHLVKRISDSHSSEQASSDALRELAELFTSAPTSVSSFELLQSGLVDGLLRFATDPERSVSLKQRQELLLDAFTTRRQKRSGNLQTPLAFFVKKLQESLTRIESFEVVTVAQGVDDSKRSSPSLLARQLRIRLVADDDSDIPRNLHNIVVSIHAIATFQALHDYLRPRVSGLLSGGSRLSGMFAALATSGLGPGTTSHMANEEPRQLTSTRSAVVPDAETNITVESSTVSRRRSQRLSAKKGPSETKNSIDSVVAPEARLSRTVASDVPLPEPPIRYPSTLATLGSEAALSENFVHDSGFTAEFADDEIDAEVFDEEMDPDNPISEKTVTLSVMEDGSRIEAQTPDGTRVATPNPQKDDPAISTSHLSLSSRASYAAALKAKPSDWHLEFSMDDHILPLDLTIYGAMHQHEMRKKPGPLPPSLIWQGIYTVKFKKVSGPQSSPENRADENPSKNRSPTPTLSSLPEDAPHTKILRLLRVLHKLNVLEAERSAFIGDKRNLPDAAFVNNKLGAKLTRQLEEPMIVASSCLPDWALDLPQHFPFLFPFATRYNFLQSSSFGYARLILKWQSQQSRGQDTSRRDDGIGFLGRLQRQKVRISRKHILESAVKVFELYGSSSSVLEVEYFDEVGTGLGPTLEFYSLISKEFARRDLKIWRDADQTCPGQYVHHPNGLFPAPISLDDIANDGGQKRTHIFRVIGQFVAKAMLDSRIIDLSLNKIFVKHILEDEVPLTIATLELVDRDLAKSLAKLQNYASLKGGNDKLFRKLAMVDIGNVEDLALDFTLPGYDIELQPGGRNIQVTSDNVEEYIYNVLDAIVGKGAQPQAKAFREGFSKVFPVSDLHSFSADELVMLFGNADEDWSLETLNEALKADHGFNAESRTIRDLIEVMVGFDTQTRRDYLQFITGSPKLPIGGFRGLNPPLTVVRKPHEAPLTADDYLPSVMTCVNYLKLPEYSSKTIMREKLRTAIKEGVGSFHLS